VSDPLELGPVIGALALVWAAAWIDFRTFRIPNALVLLGAGFGLLVQTWGSGLDGLLLSVAGLALGLMLMLPFYLFRLTGAGDVKLMGAVGAILGPAALLQALFFSLIAGGALGVVYAVAAQVIQGANGPLERYGAMAKFLWVTGRLSYIPPSPDEAMAKRLPLAVAIAIGTTTSLLWAG